MGWFGRSQSANSSAPNANGQESPHFVVDDYERENNSTTNSQNQNDRSNNNNNKVTCSQRFCAEIRCGNRRASTVTASATTPEQQQQQRPPSLPSRLWFDAADPTTGRIVDVPESFAPASGWAFLWKFASAGTAIFTLTWALLQDDSEAYFYMAYLTSWGVLWAALYLTMSVVNTVLASRTPQLVSWRIVTTWALANLAAHTGLVATLLYWPLVFEPGETDVQYLTWAQHGFVVSLVVVDAFFVNRIPIRLKHWYIVLLPFDVCFVIWTVLQQYLDVGNPNNTSDNDPTTTDDALYEGVLEWNNDWQTALTWSCVVLFGVGPALQMVLWGVSTGGCCCGLVRDRLLYVDRVDESDQRPTVQDVEEGSVFAKWR